MAQLMMLGGQPYDDDNGSIGIAPPLPKAALATGVGGLLASDDGMGSNEGPPWWGLVVPKNISKNVGP